ncbi:DsrE family protein [Alkanindiges illinoisensis]|uniref:DsrE family protein n=1 Tax=Alkanindiges illinoisensis TaxID=197183 RepID=UPI00047C94DA|nr:DsrE family protein [Alkanindiges illinoisensis]
MKSVLVIFSQGAASGQTLLEALSATMVLATFGLNVKVCLINEAISLLQAPHHTAISMSSSPPFKSAYGMVESFEFYDLLPVWVCQKQQAQLQHLKTSIEYELVNLNPALLAQFNQVLYW